MLVLRRTEIAATDKMARCAYTIEVTYAGMRRLSGPGRHSFVRRVVESQWANAKHDI
jgi:hypothetical protein